MAHSVTQSAVHPVVQPPVIDAALTARIQASVALLHQAVAEHGRVVYANSLGAEAIVLTDLICTEVPQIDIVTIDTGRLPEETLALLDRLERRFQRRFVDHRSLADDETVDGNDFPRLHQDLVADRYFFDRHVGDKRIGSAMCNSRRSVNQRPQIVLGAGDGKVFEDVASGVHDGDHDSGELLAKRQCAEHGNKGDRVHAQTA